MAKPHICIFSAVLTVNLMAVSLSFAQEAPVEPAEESVVYNRDRYDLIVERSPFGADPLADAQARLDDRAALALEREYRLCFLMQNDETGEVRAGFQNLQAKSGDPKSVLLKVGESYGGMKLVEINLESSVATIQYQGRPVEFELTKGAPPALAAAQRAAQNQPQRRFNTGFRRNTQPEQQGNNQNDRQQRAQPNRQPQFMQPRQPQATPEQLEQQRAAVQENLRQYQMEVIRSGMPPLPVPLTPEMDDQLVIEGVLPPAP